MNIEKTLNKILIEIIKAEKGGNRYGRFVTKTYL